LERELTGDKKLNDIGIISQNIDPLDTSADNAKYLVLVQKETMQ